MIKVSILVPVYNAEKYLAQCLESLVNQTLQEIEIILANDASPDNSYLIMDEYEKKYPDKVKCFYLEQNQGPIGAIRVTLPHVKGQYISMVDNDDYIELTMCEKLYNKAIETASDIVYADYAIISDDGIVNKETMSLTHRQFMGELTPIKRKCFLLSEALCWSQIVNKEYFLANFAIDITETAYRALHVKRVNKVNERLYFWRQNPTSMTRTINSAESLKCLEDAALEMYNFIFEADFDKRFEDEIKFRFIRYFYIEQLRRCLIQFDERPVEHMEYLRETVQKLYPSYLENPYINTRIEPWDLEIAKRNDISPQKLAEEYPRENVSDVRMIGSYIPRDYCFYYERLKDKAEKLFDYCRVHNYKTALWGLGERGNAFLKAYEKDNIDFVIDNDVNKQGLMLPSGHIVSAFEKKCNEIDVAFVTNNGWYNDIYNTIKAKNNRIKVVDIEVYLKFPLDLEEYFI